MKKDKAVIILKKFTLGLIMVAATFLSLTNGLPCAFEQYEVYQDGKWQKVVNGIPTIKDRIRFVF